MTFLRIAVMSGAIYFAIALILITSDRPKVRTGAESLDFARQVARVSATVPLQSFIAPDGQTLGFRRYEAEVEEVPLLMLVHGSGWHGAAFDPVARRIAAAGLADVVVPDLRGHGPDPARRGDIDYIGQLEDDLYGLYQQERQPEQAFVMAGHSSGGGLVIRYAGGEHGETLDGAVLLAPFLKYNAPTMRPNSGGWAEPLTRRIIGLTMLNAMRVRVLNHLPVIDFAFPEAVLQGPEGHTATTRYSYRLNRSYAPRADYLADVAALPPFVLIAGRADEAFVAESFEPVMESANPDGTYVLLDGVTHLDVVYAEATFEAMTAYLGGIVAE